jgi:hypothetical protein
MNLDLYSIVGLAAILLATGVVSLRLMKDEHHLRHKRILAEKY